MEIMDNLEIIMLIAIAIGIIFKLLKIIKYFLIIVVLLIGFKFFGGFENEHIQKFDLKYNISNTLKSWGESINVDGLIENLINGAENKVDERLENHRENKDRKKSEKELDRVN